MEQKPNKKYHNEHGPPQNRENYGNSASFMLQFFFHKSIRLHDSVHLLPASWHEWWSKPASAHLPSGRSNFRGPESLKWLGDDLPNLERKGCY